jgi:uncharacterized membrane protein YraQ (UPF0718 family)
MVKSYKKTLLRICQAIGVWAFWLLVWFVGAMAMDLEILLPSPTQTVKSLAMLATTTLFWKSLGLSMLRVLIGILCSVVIGTLLAVLIKDNGTLLVGGEIGFIHFERLHRHLILRNSHQCRTKEHQKKKDSILHFEDIYIIICVSG